MAGVRILVLLVLVGSIQWTVGFRTNVAENKSAWMSSSFAQSLPASNAVDGVTLADHVRYLIHTAEKKSTAWWKVDLLTPVQSALVNLYFRTNFIPRRNGVQLYTSGTNSSDPKEGNLCHTVTGRPDGRDIPHVLNVTCPGTWRYLTVYTETDNNGQGAVLDFAEVQVWICSSGTYDFNCDKYCHCLDSTCDRWTGLCPRDCRPGWQGQRCDTECTTGKYGANCTSLCSDRHCAGNSSCDDVTGSCDSGCNAGWMGVDCKEECDFKHYGPDCLSICSDRHCMENSSCDRVTGSCDSGCKAGWMGVDCKEECDPNHYGSNCLDVCFSRHCAGNSPCNSSGTCDSGCETGWTQDDCTVRVICPPGRYGQGCTEFCSSRKCKTPSSVCDVTGSCPDGCREGWQNADCRITCQSGRYGSNCSNSCDSRHCQTAPVSCDHVTGACAAGCREGWIGADCTQRCKPGTFGPYCTRCGHCDVTCNIGDGRCPGKCLDGFTGDRCVEDVRVSPVTSGVIGGAVVLVVMLLLIGGLVICLLKSGRLKWISSPSTEVRNTDTGGTGEIPAHANTAGMNEQDYTELSEVNREREEKTQYGGIQNKVYENNQI